MYMGKVQGGQREGAGAAVPHMLKLQGGREGAPVPRSW